MRLSLALSAAALSIAVPAHADPVSPAITAAVADPHRPAADLARDRYRHPAETLTFFGLKPGTTAVEVSPGGGWYTAILSPAVGPNGRLYLALGDPGNDAKNIASNQRFKARFSSPAYPNTVFTTFGKGAYTVAPEGSADLVVTFRNVHNWMSDGFAGQAFPAFYRALKPGGVLGVEEHRLPEARTTDLDGSKGYVKQSAVIQMAEAAGFKFVGASEVNANPRDTADYPQGVWTLPPNYTEGQKDRARYAAIGESDRMTLKFVKPGGQ